MDRKEKVLQKFGRYLTVLRKKKDLTIQELARASGLTAHHLRRIEAGEVDIQFSTIVSLSRGLEISPGQLLQTLDPD